MSKRYVINHITDVLDIPEESFDDFLIDLKSYRQMMQPLRDLVRETAATAGIEADLKPLRLTFIDDKKHDMSIRFGSDKIPE